MTLVGLVGTMHAIAVELSRPDLGEMNMTEEKSAFRQGETCELERSRFVEQTELDLLGMRGEQCEVAPTAFRGGPERIRRPRGHAHLRLPDQEVLSREAANSIELNRVAAQ